MFYIQRFSIVLLGLIVLSPLSPATAEETVEKTVEKTVEAVANELIEESASLERLAQWSINYGSYLLDVGKYPEALEAFDNAFESSRFDKIKVRASMHRAITMSTSLDAPEEAIKIYQMLQEKFPTQSEASLYQMGLLLFEREKYADALETFRAYIKAFHDGRFHFQVEFLIDKITDITKKVNLVVPEKPEAKPVIPKKSDIKFEGKIPEIRVLLARKASEVQFTGKGLAAHVDNKTIYLGSVGKFFVADKKITRVKEDGREESFSGAVQVTSITPIEVSFGKKTNKTVRGDIHLERAGKGLKIINHLDLESYLRSVVPSEALTSWSIETLKAQAIVTRTYALYQMQHRTKLAYDIVDNEGDQIYEGVEREHAQTDKAVTETRGKVLVTMNEKSLPRPILAMSTVNSGGYTADPQAVFRFSKPYLKAHPDPWSLSDKLATWKQQYSRLDVEKALAKVGLAVRGLKNFEPVEVGPSGRLIKVRILHEGKPFEVRTRPVLTRDLKLPEIPVKIHREGDNFIFEGKGQGHGVGYALYGGADMGKKGKDYRSILDFYYPGARLDVMW